MSRAETAMAIFITGANSFLGSSLIRSLARDGRNIVGTYRTEDARIAELGELPSVTLHQADIANAPAFEAFQGEFDTIVHVAAVSPTNETTVEDMISCNIVGTQNVHAFALRKGAKRFIFMSSISVYGNVSAPSLTEMTPLLDPHPYGASKFMCERMLDSRSIDLPTVALRLPGVLGRNAHRAWLPTVVHRALRNDDIIYYNPKNPFNNAVHVEDIASFCLSLSQRSWSGFHAFPVAASTTISVQDVIELVVSATGSKSRVSIGAPKQDGFTISSAYAARHFDYSGSPIEDVVRKYCIDPGRPRHDLLMGL
jgi:nucleoside-diphosphate-sugar epimerase